MLKHFDILWVQISEIRPEKSRIELSVIQDSNFGIQCPVSILSYRIQQLTIYPPPPLFKGLWSVQRMSLRGFTGKGSQSPSKYGPWVTPLVPVLRPDGKLETEPEVCICFFARNFMKSFWIIIIVCLYFRRHSWLWSKLNNIVFELLNVRRQHQSAAECHLYYQIEWKQVFLNFNNSNYYSIELMTDSYVKAFDWRGYYILECITA